jgi:hypothetical protein
MVPDYQTNPLSLILLLLVLVWVHRHTHPTSVMTSRHQEIICHDQLYTCRCARANLPRNTTLRCYRVSIAAAASSSRSSFSYCRCSDGSSLKLSTSRSRFHNPVGTSLLRLYVLCTTTFALQQVRQTREEVCFPGERRGKNALSLSSKAFCHCRLPLPPLLATPRFWPRYPAPHGYRVAISAAHEHIILFLCFSTSRWHIFSSSYPQ